MIKIHVGDILNATDTLQKLSQKELKARLALQIARMLKEAEREIQNFNEVRMNLITKYGEKDENNQLITDDNGNCKINPDETTVFSKELAEIIDTEVEINANKIKLDDLNNLDFTPSEMVALEPFLDEEEDK